MLAAPYGVFALLAALVVEAPSLELFQALGALCGHLIVGTGCNDRSLYQ
jgi:proton glutamate symport protein